MEIPIIYEADECEKVYILLEFQGIIEREEDLELEGLSLGELEKINDKVFKKIKYINIFFFYYELAICYEDWYT